MGSFSVNVPNDVENEFRRAAQAKFGMKQGNLTKALVEAMRDFSVKINTKPSKKAV